MRERSFPKPMSPNWPAVIGLATYMLGFSFAYVSLDAGVGALILFSGVQVTMFGGAIISGEDIPGSRWFGMGLALVGLCVLFWPSDISSISLPGMALMTAAALGWGVYSLVGRRVANPLKSTAWNFTYALPFALVVWLVSGNGIAPSTNGLILAVVSGAVTSALGYALWYQVLPRIGASIGALAQLSVPVIALVAGAMLLNESIPSSAIIASVLILGGIAIGIVWPRFSSRH